MDVQHAPARPGTRVAPLSGLQRGLWFLDRLSPGTAAYNIPWVLELDGPLEEPALRTALEAVVARHEVLRTTFDVADGEPFQVIHPARPVPLAVTDVRSLPRQRWEVAVEAAVEQDSRGPLDLRDGPLLRARLIRHGQQRHTLVVVVHHIVWDEWSLEIFERELSEAYAAALAGRRPRLPELTLSYADHATAAAARSHEHDLAYWREQLAGAPTLTTLPGDRPRPDRPTAGGDTYVFDLPSGTAERVRKLAMDCGATPFTVLLAAFSALAHRWTGADDLVIGTPVTTRDRPELDHLIGYFVNVMPLRTRITAGGSFRELAEQSRDVCFDAYGHQDTPLDTIVNDIVRERQGGHPPLVQMLFGLHARDARQMRLGGATGRRRVRPNGTAKLDLIWSVYDDGELHGEIEYATDLFDRATMARAADSWLALLDHALARPDTALADLDVLDPAGRSAALPRPARSAGATLPLHTGVEEHAVRTPAAVALGDGTRSLTYAELDGWANRLAHHLRDRGVLPGDRVGLLLDRTVEAVVAVLAVLKAGAAYVPVDLTAPHDRMAYAFGQAQVSVVVTDQPDGAADGPWKTVRLRDDAAAVAGCPATRPPVEVHADDTAYVIFTSGSTGRPKGVQIAHRHVRELMASGGRHLGIGAGDVAAMFHSYAFDVSVWELWSALLHGGRLVVVPYLLCRSPQEFAALLAAERVTLLSQTPSAFGQLTTALRDRPRELPHLRWVLLAGEALDPAAVRRWFALDPAPPAALCNLYGTTETTVHATAFDVRDPDGFERSRVGSVMPHLTQVVLDDRLRPVPVGVTGELYVGGLSLAHGYLGRSDLTAQRFLPDPFRGGGARMYRTGDLVRRLADGGLEYLGRRDGQVKIRGYRIELGEIENVLAAHPAVATCVVTVREPAPGDKRLAAYVTAAGPGEPDPGELREHLLTGLPAYMVPATFTVLAELPLTTNGKVDRKALPEPVTAVPTGARSAPPKGELQELVARVWSQVLDVAEVGAHDDFFRLGGDSLRAVRVANALRTEGWDVELQDFFRHPTVAALSRGAVPAAGGDEPALDTVPFALLDPADRAVMPAEVVDAGPTVAMQLAMAYHMELSGGTDSYHNVNSYLVSGAFDAGLLRRAVVEAMERHPVLRTSIDLMTYGEPLQLTHRHLQPPLVVTDVRHLAEADRDAAVREEFHRLRTTGFDLATPPLFAVRAHRLTDETFQLTVAEHHAILDGWSFTSLLSELLRRHAELIDDPTLAPAAPPRSGFRDFAAAERTAARDEASLRYWRDKLAGADGRLRLRPDLAPRPEEGVEPGVSGVRTTERFLPGVGARFRLAAAAGGTTPKSVAFAAHLVALGAITGSHRPVTGLSVNGRLAREGGTEALGLFLNTVPVTADTTVEPLALARVLHEEETAMIPHRRVPFALLARMMQSTALGSNFGFLRFHALGQVAEDGGRIVSDGLRFEPTMRHEPTNFALSAAMVMDPTSDDGLLAVDHTVALVPDRAVDAYRTAFLAAVEAMTDHVDRTPRDKE
ncbi:amino acid adenylation domain-containing protein [Streptomyces sp. SL13]|uniref:Amino acid adenylation domain-containing protein n=1 Tax=Streptantibioticus silvisoli TaxID=2705255 RepID=A0AA90H265_9ACTN|nr:non-ribosomal peptide synthetase [Streptantibioticus silvisoli]MDI5972678.1 amino acid adenylation domain-containing protein [Streptantibioticus silvisoli]